MKKSRPPKFSILPTERVNPRSADLDRLSPAGVVARLDAENRRVAAVVARAAARVAQAASLAAEAYRGGGKILFAGAGTSGRLGVLEAAECPPTFGVEPSKVQALMAGGKSAVFRSREGAEDDFRAGEREGARKARPQDCVIGIAASGVTPYVAGVLHAAAKCGCSTVLVTCNPKPVNFRPDVLVSLDTGPEALAGSTRMKAGSATKMALNSITTAAMVLCGKVYGNRMVDLKPCSAKLEARAVRLVAELGKVGQMRALALLESAGWEAKTAIVMARRKTGAAQARGLLAEKGGFLRGVIG